MGEETITKVGIAVVEHRGRYLVGLREDPVPLAGLAEFPGGKCRPSEPAAECAVRECAEETGLRVKIVEPLQHRRYEYPHGLVDLSFFLCEPLEKEPIAERHGAFEWVTTAALHDLDFPPANRPVIDRLLERVSRTASNPTA